ncbi:MAG TPA: serine/threonine-protein kinase [Ktedonobacteraceae bacterium]
MEETSGTRFGNYELIRRIDIGGMGEVYLAHQLTAFNRIVAIKIIRSDLVHDATARARFLREAEVSAHLKHEHILSLFEFGEVEGRLYLVTPYIEGGTLATRLKTTGPLSLAETHKLFVPLVQAVAYIHRRGVIHRDLKPTNIMLDTEDGELYVRLIDFGIATLQGRSASPPLTTAGHEMGTVAYMAPERLSGIAAPSNDIFSLGVILHQMLTGRMPIAAPLSPNSAAPRLAEPLARVVREAIASNPNERYASAEELLNGFERAYQQVISPAQVSVPTSAEGKAVPFNSRPVLNQSAPSRPSELVSLAHSGELPVPISPTPQRGRLPSSSSFTPDDYNAPTTSFQQPQFEQQPRSLLNSRPPLLRPKLPKPPRQPRMTKRNSLGLIISAAIVVVLLIFACMLYYGYQVVAATSVSINFSPRTQVISQVVTFKADPRVSTVNSAQAIIPEGIQKAQKSTSQTTDTTGRVNCAFAGFGCEPGVSQDDVDTLTAQMQPSLDQSIKQDLENQIASKHGTQIGSIYLSNLNITSTPAVGMPGRTVTVTLAEQGSVGYFLRTDATKVAHQALANAVAHLGGNYQMVGSTVSIGSFAIRSIDQASGVSTIATSEGAVALYQFTQVNLQTISKGLLGKSLATATTFLQNQPGIDPASIKINFTAGNSQNMPNDIQHIKLIPLNPASLPDVSFTPVAGTTTSIPTFTPTNNGN